MNFLIPYPEDLAKHLLQIDETRRGIVHSRPCREKEDFMFDFKGQIINNEFDGTGVLKITKTGPNKSKEKYGCWDALGGNSCL